MIVTKIDGPSDISFSKIKSIGVESTKDLYNADIRKSYKFEGNGFYIDKTIDYTDPDYERRPIRIEDLSSKIWLEHSTQFHSFANGIENDFVIVNRQGMGSSDCKIRSYSIFYKDAEVLSDVTIDSIDSTDSYFDTVTSEDGS